jgi:hypothetical protein
MARSKIKYTYQGQEYTIDQLAEMKGMRPKSLEDRIRNHGVEEAMARPVKIPKAIKYEWKGSFYTIVELAAMKGLSTAGMRIRIKVNGIDKAMKMPVEDRKPKAKKPAPVVIEPDYNLIGEPFNPNLELERRSENLVHLYGKEDARAKASRRLV